MNENICYALVYTETYDTDMFNFEVVCISKNKIKLEETKIGIQKTSLEYDNSLQQWTEARKKLLFEYFGRNQQYLKNDRLASWLNQIEWLSSQLWIEKKYFGDYFLIEKAEPFPELVPPPVKPIPYYISKSWRGGLEIIATKEI